MLVLYKHNYTINNNNYFTLASDCLSIITQEVLAKSYIDIALAVYSVRPSGCILECDCDVFCSFSKLVLHL